MKRQGLVYTNANCISCNKCVRVCTSPGASYVNVNGRQSAVEIHPERCISCGACFAICDHGAREYRDDTEVFFRDLRAGEAISVLFAPSFPATYPDEYAAVLGGLKALGVKRLIPVSFGADICTWAYIQYIREGAGHGLLSTTCPVTVSYAEHCQPELIPHLVPIQSPLLCAAIYCREELGITDRLAFIGPCIGKKLETSEYMDGSPLDYNVTFLKLMEYVRENRVYGAEERGEIPYGLGSFYPAPGGLADNLRWFLGDDEQIRVVSGKTYLYRWLRSNADSISKPDYPFLLIDALNCQEGCLEGTATEAGRFDGDAPLSTVQQIRRKSKNAAPDSPWNPALTPEARLANLNRQFGGLSLSRYLRSFTNRSGVCEVMTPTEQEADEIFNRMHKTTEESRKINCSTCGYRSCYDLMKAIYNHFNTRRSCIYFQKEEALMMERLSFYDQLTSVMNRNALEKLNAGTLYQNKSVALFVADVNGLKETNDHYGHEAGDRLIVATASSLTGVFGRQNVYRTGGDEFLVIMQDCAEEECTRDVALVRRALEEKGASASIGFVYRAHFNGDLLGLQALADQEMYKDKDLYYQRTGKKRRL